VVALQGTYGDGNVGEGAEPLRFVGQGVVKAAPEIDRNQPLHRGNAGRVDRAAGGVQKRLQKTLVPGVFGVEKQEPGQVLGPADVVQVLRGVNQQQLLLGHRLGREKLLGPGNAGGDELVSNPPRLFDIERVPGPRFEHVIHVLVPIEEACREPAPVASHGSLPGCPGRGSSTDFAAASGLPRPPIRWRKRDARVPGARWS
jgi:hypothetical protein